MSKVELGGDRSSPEDFLEEEIQPAACGIEVAVQIKIERKRPACRKTKLPENRIPREPPSARGIRIDGETVVEESETHFAVLASYGIVEAVVLVPHSGKPFECSAKQFKLPAAFSCGRDHAKLPQAVIRGRGEICGGLRLRQSKREDSPEIELIVSGEAIEPADSNVCLLAIAIRVREEVVGVEDGVWLQRNAGIERTEGVLDEAELRSGKSLGKTSA